MRKAISLTAVLEDYLEAIFNLSRFGKAARSRDIAETLQVHKSTVTAALKVLGRLKLIDYSPYEAVTLTPEGSRLAEDVLRRHTALRDFFTRILKIDVELAESAACGMEHSVPREIVERLAGFADAVLRCRRKGADTGGFCGAFSEAPAKRSKSGLDSSPKRGRYPRSAAKPAGRAVPPVDQTENLDGAHMGDL